MAELSPSEIAARITRARILEVLYDTPARTLSAKAWRKVWSVLKGEIDKEKAALAQAQETE